MPYYMILSSFTISSILKCCFLCMHKLCTILQNHPYTFLHFSLYPHPFCAGHVTLSRRQWYPIQYPSTKLTNHNLHSPWPFSLQFDAPQSWAQGMASIIFHEQHVLATVIIVFMSTLLHILFNWNAKKMCLMIKYGFGSIVHNASYCSGIDGIVRCFGTVYSRQTKTWKD